MNNVEKMIAAAPNMPKTRSGLRLTAAIDSSPTTVETAVMPMGSSSTAERRHNCLFGRQAFFGAHRLVEVMPERVYVIGHADAD